MGVVEGFTEFLPISSTAHLVLTAKFLDIPQTEFVKSFEIAIQLGAILAVVWYYHKEIFLNKEIGKKIISAFIPTAVLGFAFYKIVKSFLLESTETIIWTMLLGGIFLIIFELWHKEKPEAIDNIEKISYAKCFLIGVFQAVAIVPGVSRAAATILGGLFLGLKRKIIVEFSFLLAVPTMLSATGYDLLKNGYSFSSDQFGVLLSGFLVSFFVALISIRFLLAFIKRNNFVWFGVYRVVFAVLLIFLYL